MFEFPATGGIFTSVDFHAVKLLRYVNTFDFIVLACEIIYIIFIIYYIVEESIEIKHNGFIYFNNIWNLLDLTVIIVSCVNVVLIFYSNYEIDLVLGDLLAKPDEFADFVYLGSW